MKRYTIDVDVLGPWSLATSRAFWEGFAPAALPAQGAAEQLRTVFCVERNWRRAEAHVTQQNGTAHLVVSGDGDLEVAAAQACRFLSLDVDGRAWPDVSGRDPIIADAQAQLPGLRPCSSCPACGRAASTRRTRPPSLQCCPSGSASSKPPAAAGPAGSSWRRRCLSGAAGTAPAPSRPARPEDRVPARRRGRRPGGASRRRVPALGRPGGGRSSSAAGEGARAIRRRTCRSPRRQRTGRPASTRAPAGGRGRRALRPRSEARRGRLGVAAVPHLGRRPPAHASGTKGLWR